METTNGKQKSIKELLLAAPGTQLDSCLFPIIEGWDDEPKAIQILEVLDKVIYASLGSGFTVVLLQALYSEALKKEGKTSKEVEALAIWRKDLK